MSKMDNEKQTTDIFSAFLRNQDVKGMLIEELSQSILNFFNNKYDISYGLALAILGDGNAPFSTSAFNSISDELGEAKEHLEEELEVPYWDMCDALERVLMGFLSDNWSSIIQERLIIEGKFSHPADFVALRRFMVVLKELDILFYTKASDGGGPDIIGGTVISDLVHSDYETMDTIKEKYSCSSLVGVMNGYDEFVVDGFDEPYMFANISFDIIRFRDRGLEFFGPASDEDFYKFIKPKKKQFVESLAELAKSLSLPITLDLKFRAREDRIIFDIVWERKLPEEFYTFFNHEKSNKLPNN